LLSYLLGELEVLELLTSDERLKHRYQKMRVVLESISTLSRKLSSIGNLRKGAELLNINRVLEDLHPLIKFFVPAGVQYEVYPDPDLKPVRLNRAVLEQIILNLVMNAVEAVSAPGGLIRVRTKDDGDYAVLIVEDNGTGIKEELQELVFEPFFTTKDSGSGLGLSLIRHWVEEVGGEISLESREGQGSRFIVRFPVAPSFRETR
ncbi:MAG: HAMP domain-containing histidine kinase, partial [Thermodesulfobacteria bacterium]|nr:HAMP domain-containing histidine kinase [Thermodesulfobacteriota bacterium]